MLYLKGGQCKFSSLLVYDHLEVESKQLYVHPLTHNRRLINSPVNNRFQANDHQLAFEIAKFEIVYCRKCGECLHEHPQGIRCS